jgi:hypothetical protein
MSLVALLYRAPRVKGLTVCGEDVNRITQWRTLVGDVVVTITRSPSQLDDLIGTRRKAGIADTEDKVPEIADIDTALEGGLPVHIEDQSSIGFVVKEGRITNSATHPFLGQKCQRS